MYKFIAILLCVCVTAIFATDVSHCTDGKPFPLDVRIVGCDAEPCVLLKGTNVVFEIDIVAYKYITQMTTLARATTIGITVPYVLPDEVCMVCRNLLYGAYCPLYATEDVTYLFVFPIGNYPEISVKVEISIVDQDEEVVSCFVCDIKIRKGNTGNSTAYEISL